MTSAQTEVDNVIDQARQGARKTARDWREHATPVVNDLVGRANGLAHEGADWVRDNSHRARRRLSEVSDSSIDYAREKPARTALAVVAAGVLMYGAWLLLSPRNRR